MMSEHLQYLGMLQINKKGGANVKAKKILSLKRSSILLIGILAITVLIFSIIFAKYLGKENIGTIDSKVASNNLKKLPKLNQINPDKNPILYDFVNSSISYRSNINPSDWGFYYAVLQDQRNKGVIYVEYYTYGEKLTFPSLGTAPYSLKLNESEISYVDNFSKKMSSNRIYGEKYSNDNQMFNWKCLIISQYSTSDEDINGDSKFNYCDKVGRWAGIDMIQFIGKSEGLMSQTINSGVGWPINWLKKAPYSKKILQYEGYDVNDDFWNKYNIKSFKMYKDGNGNTLKVEVAQLDRFRLKINGDYVNMNKFQLEEYLKNQGWRQ